MNEPGPFGEAGREPVNIPPDDFEVAATLNGVTQRIAKQIGEAKGRWLEKLALKILPPEVAQLARGKPSDAMKASRWMAANKIRIEEHPDGRTRLMRGDEVVGEFRVQFKDNKFVVEERIPKEKPSPN